MADTKNYGLKGVGDDVQFGKAGGRFVFNTGASDFRATTDGSTLSHLQVLTPVGDTDAATKLYVDNIASGLDPKESCQAATVSAGIGTYATTPNNGQFTSVAATIDGVTLAEGDRVLVKNQATASQNGIYVVQSTTTTLTRAPDQDGTPASNVSAGNYTFVEQGATNKDSGWVLQGDGQLTLNTHDLDWVLFSTSSDIVAGNGLVKNGNVLDLDFSELTSASVIATSDELIFQDATVESRITVANFLADRDIVTATANGILTRTANDTYASRTLTASAVAGDEGISIVNGNGVSGNPTIGIDILGQTNLATDDVDDADEMLIYHSNAAGTEGVGNYAITASKLKTYMNAGTSATSITEGDTTLAVSDSGTDGTLTFTADNVVQFTVDDTTFTTADNLNFSLAGTSSLTIASLTENDVMIVGASGLVEDSGGNLTFDGSTLTVTGDLDVDNININLNTISNTSTNADLILLPNGTGSIILQNGSGEEILELNDTASAINGLAITAGATGNPAQITTGTGSEANIDIGFLTNGTGAISVVAGSGSYEDNVTADDDIPNKKYVDDLVAATGGSGTLDSVRGTVNIATLGDQNIGAAGGIPANAIIVSVTVDVDDISDTTSTVTVGNAVDGDAVYMVATENDPEVLGLYKADLRVVNGGTARQATATVIADSTASASAEVIITFIHA